ncbi:vWA domain-containing protein [Litorilituus lipolyticus]|uniref:VWA domain-containing protein n=1 Tax=Litorilituus lipolyticus TaxID=2491017 RepID=A0A502KWK8_9GAMM|nr:VWA domain-containing protein [Litorilituus lipolyticus]TPH15906.1 VWA domain-containing protein [Litorilituus lipolyticus]
MIEFAHPEFLILLPLPLLIIWLAPAYKERKPSVKVPYFARLVDVTGEKPESGAVLLSRNNIQRFFIALAWLCLVTAMTKPEKIGPAIEQQKSARDLMVAVDLSGSMSVEDFTLENNKTVDRLSAVKQVLATFAQHREHDRLGLILFGDAPYLQAPFTADITTWLTLLNESEIGMAGQSTAFGDAIGLAISVFESSETKNRVLIALTDGNDTGSKVPPIEAAKVAARYDIKIYTIAIGDPTAVGEEKVDLDVLQQMSDITGGKSFQALNREELQQVYQEINIMEPQLFDSLSFRPRTSIHHYPIILFASIYLISLSLVSLRFYIKRKRLKTLKSANEVN